MDSAPRQIIVTKSVREHFDPTPIYVPISPTDVATVWRISKSSVFFAPGKYLGLAKEGNQVTGQRYRALTDSEKELVLKAVNAQYRDAVVRFELF